MYNKVGNVVCFKLGRCASKGLPVSKSPGCNKVIGTFIGESSNLEVLDL